VQSATFATEAKNIAILTGGSILITLVAQFTAAEVVTHMPKRAGTVAKYLLVLPIVLPPLVLIEVWAYLLQPGSGLIDVFLRAAGLPQPTWLSDPHLALAGILLIGFPWISNLGFLIFLGGLQNLEQRSAPSWRYMIDQGATTIWERWDGWTSERGFQSAWMNSFNHYALGSVGEWLYRFVLGIDQEPGSAGFQRLLIRPHPGGSLRSARGSYRSVRGLISSAWQLEEGQSRFQIQIPPNAVASVRIPSADGFRVRDATGRGPAEVASFPGAAGAQEAVFEVGSGRHEFTGPAAGAGTPRAGEPWVSEPPA
jgi:hypothetical protein